jgi:aspartate-semialdehyde dehydrogenase
MNVPVFPLHKAFGVKRAVVSTYQAASGAGLLAMQELEQQAHDFANGDPLTQDIFGRQYAHQQRAACCCLLPAACRLPPAPLRSGAVLTGPNCARRPF